MPKTAANPFTKLNSYSVTSWAVRFNNLDNKETQVKQKLWMPNRDHPKLSFMGLPQFFFWFPFSVLTLFKPWRKLNRPTLVELLPSNNWQVVGFISSERPCSDYWFSLIEEAWGERRVWGGGGGLVQQRRGGGALVGGGSLAARGFYGLSNGHGLGLRGWRGGRGGFVGSISTNRNLHHKYRSPKRSL